MMRKTPRKKRVRHGRSWRGKQAMQTGKRVTIQTARRRGIEGK
jgi:hypothetical protein